MQSWGDNETKQHLITKEKAGYGAPEEAGEKLCAQTPACAGEGLHLLGAFLGWQKGTVLNGNQ